MRPIPTLPAAQYQSFGSKAEILNVLPRPAEEGEIIKWIHKTRYNRLKITTLEQTACRFCGAIPEYVIKYRDNGGGVHCDPYFIRGRKLIMSTVDHILPKSLGGRNTIENYRPLCATCNTNRGNDISLEDYVKIIDNLPELAKDPQSARIAVEWKIRSSGYGATGLCSKTAWRLSHAAAALSEEDIWGWYGRFMEVD